MPYEDEQIHVELQQFEHEGVTIFLIMKKHDMPNTVILYDIPEDVRKFLGATVMAWLFAHLFAGRKVLVGEPASVKLRQIKY